MAEALWQWPTALSQFCATEPVKEAAEPVDQVARRSGKNRASPARDAGDAQAAPAKAKAVPAKAGADAGSAKAAAAKAEVPRAKRGAAKRGAAKRGAAEPASDATPAGGTAPEVDGAEAADTDALRPESPELLSGRETAADGGAPAAGRAQIRGASEEPSAAAGGTPGEAAGAAANKSEAVSAAEPSEALPATTNVLASLADEDEAGGCKCVGCVMAFWGSASQRPPVASNDEAVRCCSLWIALFCLHTEDTANA